MHASLPLRQLVRRLDALSVAGTLDATVAGLAYDPRRVGPGAVFFAVPGAATDDGLAIPRAIERGAAAIVCEQPGYVPYRATQIRVANCRRAMATAAAAFFGHPGRHLKVVLVTGDRARGMVACLLQQVLGSAGVQVGWAGSRGCRIGERVLPPLPAEPEALDVQEVLAHMRRAGCQTCVLELSPQALEQVGLGASEVEAVVVTELRPEAAPDVRSSGASGWSGTAGNGFAGKQIAGCSGGVWRLSQVPAEDEALARGLTLRLARPRQAPWIVRARQLRATPGSTRLQIRTPQGELDLCLPLAGLWNAQAGVAAATLALAIGVSLPAVGTALRRARGVPGSLEAVPAGRRFHVLVDAASSSVELEACLRMVRGFHAGRILLLFGGAGGGAAAERAALGAVAARSADVAVLTSNNPGWEAPEAIAAQVASGYFRCRGTLPRIVLDRAVAIREMVRAARRGDCVVLAGQGHRKVQEMGGCVLPFDDRAHARAALATFDSRPRGEEVVTR